MNANLSQLTTSEDVNLPKRSRCPYCDRLYNRDVLDDHISRCRTKTRRQQPITQTNRRRKVVVDGNNIAYYLSPDGKPKVAGIILALRSLKQVGLQPTVIVSSALKHKIDDAERLRELINSGQIREAPRGTNDDLYIIRLAEKINADIISNDRFLDWQNRYPWIPTRLRKYRMTPSGLILV